MGKLFGTDGVRGIANKELTCELAMNIGRALAMVLREKDGGRKKKVLIGTDTRISADMLDSAIAAGLCSGGADAYRVGIVPTPAVAYLSKKYGMDAGVMISASHNPFQDNGIKIFSGDGYKLSDAQEEKIEGIIQQESFIDVTGGELGRTFSMHANAVQDYVDFVVSTAGHTLEGLKIAIDCSNGSASVTARQIFGQLGAECSYYNDSPNGVNINQGCGSTHMEAFRRIVRDGDFHLGLAFDGDADRCLAVDENGSIIDGDQMIAICAQHMKQAGTLKGAVVTIMSNLGFFQFTRRNGIPTETTKVGDRYVLESMVKNGYNIGGEQSGHVIFTDFMTTGDGQVSALQLLSVMQEKKQPLSQLASVMEVCPQVLKNLRTTNERKKAYEQDERISSYIRREQEKMGADGRLLIRASGTEPLIRVMVEGRDPGEIEETASRICRELEQLLASL